ncbi:hypothetical protein DPMN_180091 [Dreissena polymorpha]|uniref:Fibrinogen C-terminal domain-containing protein n=1 Tax=Dreissena polymorpha TaxID=45954 RepID=A0A9D4EIG7_DREPO|nr:hypothetical protein DPMN_180091 [Dreissena polymorpha]
MQLGDSSAGQAFSTYDHSNDIFAGNCAELFKGAWWYYSCFVYNNLNGLYRPGKSANQNMMYDSSVGLAASTIMFKSV